MKKNLQKPPRTLAEVNKVIQQKHPLAILCKAGNYFYVTSDDYEFGIKLAELYTTSIHVYSLGQQSLEKWVQDVDNIINQIEQE